MSNIVHIDNHNSMDSQYNCLNVDISFFLPAYLEKGKTMHFAPEYLSIKY